MHLSFKTFPEFEGLDPNEQRRRYNQALAQVPRGWRITVSLLVFLPLMGVAFFLINQLGVNRILGYAVAGGLGGGLFALLLIQRVHRVIREDAATPSAATPPAEDEADPAT